MADNKNWRWFQVKTVNYSVFDAYLSKPRTGAAYSQPHPVIANSPAW